VTLRCSVTPARGPQRERKKHACSGKDGRQEVAGIERAAPVGEDTGDDRADHLPGADEDGENTEAVCGLSGPHIVSDSGPIMPGMLQAERPRRITDRSRKAAGRAVLTRAYAPTTGDDGAGGSPAQAALEPVSDEAHHGDVGSPTARSQ
jgi:hypothetical protein